MEKEFKRQLEILSYGAVEITPRDEFERMLRSSLEQNRPLRIKCGIDPTSPDIHLGHLIPYKKMRQFQDLGHQGVVIIGDFTACIGDPTGKDESRSSLSAEAVRKNAADYMEQVYTVLDRQRTEIHYQTEWFGKANLVDLIHWASQTTVAKLLGHETFRKRLDGGNPLSLHEMIYPVLQGIDSVYINADVELGGTDQKFNVLMGRDYQKARNLRPQVAMLLPIITGTCGTAKMSKSLGNYIGIRDLPFDKFGKVMSIPDTLMKEYFQYVVGLDRQELAEIEQGLQQGKLHPNETKKDLAQRIVSFFHGKEVGAEMRAQFEAVFKKGEVPDDVADYRFSRGADLATVLSESGVLASKGEARRLIQQNAVRVVDGERLGDAQLILDESFANKVIKVGKRKFLRLV